MLLSNTSQLKLYNYFPTHYEIGILDPVFISLLYFYCICIYSLNIFI